MKMHKHINVTDSLTYVAETGAWEFNRSFDGGSTARGIRRTEALQGLSTAYSRLDQSLATCARSDFLGRRMAALKLSQFVELLAECKVGASELSIS